MADINLMNGFIFSSRGDYRVMGWGDDWPELTPWWGEENLEQLSSLDT